MNMKWYELAPGDLLIKKRDHRIDYVISKQHNTFMTISCQGEYNLINWTMNDDMVIPDEYTIIRSVYHEVV